MPTSFSDHLVTAQNLFVYNLYKLYNIENNPFIYFLLVDIVLLWIYFHQVKIIVTEEVICILLLLKEGQGF